MRLIVHDYAGHPFQIQLSRELARRGHTVRHAFAGALQTPRGELARREDDPPSFDVLEVPMDPEYAKYKYSFRRRRRMEIAYGRRVAEMLTAWKPDVVLSANTPTETQTPVLRAAMGCGAAFVVWQQDFYSIAVDKVVRKKIPFIGRLIGGYYRWLEKRQLQASDRVVAITADFVPIMTEEFGVPRGRLEVIPNWAPVETLPVLPKDNEWSRARQLHDRFVFLYTGTLGMKHNPRLLLELAREHRANREVQVVVISEGPGASWLTEHAAQHGLTNLRVLPYQPFHVLPQIMAAGDVLVAVLEEDAGVFSVPSKVLTYLCAERPLLLAVPPENLAARTVNEQQAGLTVAPSAETDFLQAAARLRADREAARQMAVNARRYAEKTFRISEIGDRFEKILKAACGAPDSPAMQ